MNIYKNHQFEEYGFEHKNPHCFCLVKAEKEHGVIYLSVRLKEQVRNSQKKG